MLLMISNESQAVLGRLFFSPSAATLWRGTPDPTLWLSGSARRPARAPAGPQPGPVQLGDVPGSSALGGAGRDQDQDQVMDASQCGNDRPRFGVHEVS